MQIIFRRWSHVGRRPITFGSQISVKLLPVVTIKRPSFGQTAITKQVVSKGPLGELSFPLHTGLNLKMEPGPIQGETVLRIAIDEEKFEKLSKYCKMFVKAMWGTTSSLISQHIEGVSEGYQVSLRLVGVGYKASIENNKVDLKVGYTHPILLEIPVGIKAVTPSPTKIILTGCNLQQVTQFAAKIRSFKKPEPYNGKGIFVGNETITLKEGKKK